MLIDYFLIGGTVGISLYGISKIHLPAPHSKESLHVGKVVFDFHNNNHLLVCGGSGSGKSVFVEILLQKYNGEIYLCNCFQEDFKTLTKAKRVNGVDNIKSLLTELNSHYHNKMVHVVIDELLEMSILDKNFSKFLTTILATARHNNLNIIAISQLGLVEILGNSKQLFNNRVVLSLNDVSSIRAVINNIDDVQPLFPRQFYYLTKGKTGKAKVPVLRW